MSATGLLVVVLFVGIFLGGVLAIVCFELAVRSVKKKEKRSGGLKESFIKKGGVNPPPPEGADCPPPPPPQGH